MNLISFFFLALTYLTAWFGGQLLPFTPTYPSSELLNLSYLPAGLAHLGGFDGVHYLTIIDSGYLQVGGMPAFFPLYPLLIRLLSGIGLGSPLIIGLLLSLAATLGFCRLVPILWRAQGLTFGRWYLAFTLLAPAGFFFVCLYTESLFMLLLILVWLAYRQKKYWLVALGGIFLTATRLNGILVLAALGLDYFYHAARAGQLRQTRTWRNLALIAGGSLGLLGFMTYLQVHFGDPLYFFHLQSQFWQRQTQLISLPQVFYRYLRAFVQGDVHSWAYVQELLAGSLGLLILAWESYRTYRRRSLHLPGVILLWSWLFYLLPTLTGTFQSLPRYFLLIWVYPFFLARLAQRSPRLGGLLVSLSCGIMLINLTLFIQGLWVT